MHIVFYPVHLCNRYEGGVTTWQRWHSSLRRDRDPRFMDSVPEWAQLTEERFYPQEEQRADIKFPHKVEIKYKELDADNIKLINLFNTANRANWCNKESARQLKNLAEEILKSYKIHKADLASYILNISKYVGGGIPAELKVIDDIKE